MAEANDNLKAEGCRDLARITKKETTGGKMATYPGKSHASRPIRAVSFYSLHMKNAKGRTCENLMRLQGHSSSYSRGMRPHDLVNLRPTGRGVARSRGRSFPKNGALRLRDLATLRPLGRGVARSRSRGFPKNEVLRLCDLVFWTPYLVFL